MNGVSMPLLGKHLPKGRQDMNPAEFRSLREGLGLEAKDVSMLTLIPEARLKLWEQGDDLVPEGAAGLLLDIEREIESRLTRALDRAQGREEISLLRFRNPLDFKRHGPDMAPIPSMLAYKCHGALITRLYHALRARGQVVTVHYFAAAD